jgi:hypothetical protein
MMDIEPTMDDSQVMEFTHSGFVIAEGVIADEINRQCETLPKGGMADFVRTVEFRRAVFLNPRVSGIVRSLLGENFIVPAMAHHHLYEGVHAGQTWHSDGLTESGYGVTHLQCYYYPHAVEIEDGPTMVLPGSQFRLVNREAIAHYRDILGQMSLTVPAGTVVLTRYGIWHKAGPKFNSRRRSMIKFSYYRTNSPERDWLGASQESPKFRHPSRHPYVTEVESYRDQRRCERTWEWLCGRDETAAVFDCSEPEGRGIPLSEIEP